MYFKDGLWISFKYLKYYESQVFCNKFDLNFGMLTDFQEDFSKYLYLYPLISYYDTIECNLNTKNISNCLLKNFRFHIF